MRRGPLVLLALAALTGPAPAQRDDETALLGPPLTLPETLRGTVRVPSAAAAGGPVDTLRQLYPALTACWHAPDGLAWLERTEITARLSLRRDGTLQGEPRITFAALPPDSPARRTLTQATLDAIRRCTPVALTPGLGGAVAGRPIALRFIYAGPRGPGA